MTLNGTAQITDSFEKEQCGYDQRVCNESCNLQERISLNRLYWIISASVILQPTEVQRSIDEIDLCTDPGFSIEKNVDKRILCQCGVGIADLDGKPP